MQITARQFPSFENRTKRGMVNKVLFQTGPEKSTTEYFHLCTCCAVRDKSRNYEEMNGILHRTLFLKLQVRGAPITPQRQMGVDGTGAKHFFEFTKTWFVSWRNMGNF